MYTIAFQDDYRHYKKYYHNKVLLLVTVLIQTPWGKEWCNFADAPLSGFGSVIHALIQLSSNNILVRTCYIITISWTFMFITRIITHVIYILSGIKVCIKITKIIII